MPTTIMTEMIPRIILFTRYFAIVYSMVFITARDESHSSLAE